MVTEREVPYYAYPGGPLIKQVKVNASADIVALYAHGAKPEHMPMMKCPACDLWLPEEDFDRQRVHMMANHPTIIETRLAEHRRWDGWEDGN